MIRYLIICGGLVLAGCCAAPARRPSSLVQPVVLPVAQPCSADPGPAPAFVDTAAAIVAAPDVFVRAKIYAAGRQQRIAWEARLAAANAACRGHSLAKSQGGPQ